MRLSVGILIALAACVAVVSFSKFNRRYTSEATLEEMQVFNAWAAEHNKKYDTPREKLFRLRIFLQRLAKIAAHNNQNASWKMGLNQFSDMDVSEVKAKYFGLAKKENTKEEEEHIEWDHLNATPSSNGIDWVATGAVTQIKDQARCGSCWAFSATGALEGLDFIHNRLSRVNSYSEQQLVDCSRLYGNQGCNGGLMQFAFRYAIVNGITFEENYPYKAVDQKCLSKAHDFKIDWYKNVPHKSSGALIHALETQPISVSIDAEKIISYQSGVFSDKTCYSELNHGVLLVAFDDDVWRVKNSWSTKWGEQGYIRFSRSAVPDTDGGICGILLDASYPTVN
jgi:C1A family cysteine protease